ncbi:hypothetical protein TNCV_2755761 [Trichonephila clavipes]|nr:hypothetical protein TNCV_2755761 [Trichonephila clavipes]
MREKVRRKIEKAGNVNINKKKPSERQKKKRRVSLPSSIEEIPLDTTGDNVDEDNNDDFCAVYKEYILGQKGPKCDWIQCIECNKSLYEDCICTE